MAKRTLISCIVSLSAAGCVAFPAQQPEKRPYFQQSVDYTIDVRLDDTGHFLRGSESLTYHNQSPDTLDRIYFHVWPNAYRDEYTVLAKTYYSDNDLRFITAGETGRGWIDSLDFRTAETALSWHLLADTPDIAVVELLQPLLPGDSTIILTPFRLKYPSAGISRLGHSGQAYYTTQWYPKPAVYDQNGWKYFPYVDKGEYYGEFGRYDVRITLPENYRVGATGVLVDGEKEYAWLDSLSGITARIDSFNPKALGFPPSSAGLKTLHYRQDRVHDFAFFADKRWHVAKRTMQLQGDGRKVDIYAFFTNHRANWWIKAPEYMERAVQDFSRWIGEYPYDVVSAVDVIYAQGGDMEYPMITAIGSPANPYQLDAVLAHELGHNWFYGILGSDERKHPWQDEGINSFFEKRYLFTNYAADSAMMNEYFNRMGRWGKWTKNTRMDGRLKQYYRYLADARLNIDQPLTLRSEAYTLRNYSDMVYAKTSLGFQYLLQYLGDSLFNRCMREYYAAWSFRHPSPEDLEEVFERVSGKQLDWLFEGWLQTTGKLDYAVKDVSAAADGFDISLRNHGDIDGPVRIDCSTTNGISRSVWLEGFSGDTTLHLQGKPVLPHIIDGGQWMPEVNRKNNSFRERGIVRRIEPLQLRFLTDVEDENRTQVYVAPAAGWNYYNSVMTGIILHNVGYPQKNFEFAAMPLFAFGTKDLNGGGYLSYRLHPGGTFFREIRFRSGVQHYAYAQDVYSNPTIDLELQQTLRFNRLENSIRFELNNATPRNHISSSITVRHLFLHEEQPYFRYYLKDYYLDRNYYQLTYAVQREPSWNAFRHEVSATFNREFMRFWANATYRIPYTNPKKGVEIGGGLGYVNINDRTSDDYRLRLSGRNGTDDYLYDEVFLGRSEKSGILSQQFVAVDGGFATPTGFYRLAEHVMGSLHIKTDLPGKLPLRLFFNMAMFDQPNLNFNKDSKLSYEGGVEINVIRDIFTVYLPLIYSKDLRYAIDEQELDFGELIRFEFHLRKLNPLETLNR